jgi:hypothetical protein
MLKDPYAAKKKHFEISMLQATSNEQKKNADINQIQ